jgi:transposase
LVGASVALGDIPQGYIYPKAERAVRDLLRKRGQLVRLQPSQILSLENLMSRNTGKRLSSNHIKRLSEQALEELFDHAGTGVGRPGQSSCV